MWMSKNTLKLNADKTQQLIWLGTRQLAKLTVTQLRLTSSVVEFDSTVTDLGVVLDIIIIIIIINKFHRDASLTKTSGPLKFSIFSHVDFVDFVDFDNYSMVLPF